MNGYISRNLLLICYQHYLARVRYFIYSYTVLNTMVLDRMLCLPITYNRIYETMEKHSSFLLDSACKQAARH